MWAPINCERVIIDYRLIIRQYVKRHPPGCRLGCRLGATNPRQRRSDRTTKNLALCFIFKFTLFYKELTEFNTCSFSYSALLKVEVFLPSLLSS